MVGSIEEQIKAELGFEQLKALGETWALKLDTFYSENSHLVTEIQEVVLGVICNTSKTLDTDKFAAERASFHRRMEQRRLAAFRQEKEKKQDLLQSLQQQIKLSNELRNQQKMKERLEDRKLQEYFAALDKQEAEGTRGFARNYFPRSASGLDVCDGERLAILSSKSEPCSIAEYCGNDDGNDNQGSETGQFQGEIGLHSDPLENTSARPRDQKEIRFNPDKIITRDPQPYAFSPISDFGRRIS